VQASNTIRIDISLPRSWAEITPAQLKVIACEFQKPYSQEELLTQIFLKFTGWRIKKSYGPIYLIYRIKDKLTFSCEIGNLFPSIDSLKWITSGFDALSFSPAIGELKSPNKLLYNTTLEQFLMAENIFSAHCAQPDKSLLLQLVNIYWGGELGVKPVDLYSALIWFAGVKTWITKKYPFVFSASGQSTTDPAESIFNLLEVLNSGDITKNETILRTHVHEVFYHLNAEIEKHKKDNKHVFTV
jgi:hypothetical protein